VHNKVMNFIYYTDSIGQRHQLFFTAHSYPNLMEFIRDNAYEDWGDCRGRAWCATCHIKIKPSPKLLKDPTEEHRLSLLSNLSINSRLACQISLDQNLHQLEICFIGDD